MHLKARFIELSKNCYETRGNYPDWPFSGKYGNKVSGIRYSPENGLKRPSRKTPPTLFAVSNVIRYNTVRYRKSNRKTLYVKGLWMVQSDNTSKFVFILMTKKSFKLNLCNFEWLDKTWCYCHKGLFVCDTCPAQYCDMILKNFMFSSYWFNFTSHDTFLLFLWQQFSSPVLCQFILCWANVVWCRPIFCHNGLI